MENRLSLDTHFSTMPSQSESSKLSNKYRNILGTIDSNKPAKKVRWMKKHKSSNQFSTFDTLGSCSSPKLVSAPSAQLIAAKLNVRRTNVNDVSAISDFGGGRGLKFAQSPRIHAVEKQLKTPGPAYYSEQRDALKAHKPIYRFSTDRTPRLAEGYARDDTVACNTYYPRKIR